MHPSRLTGHTADSYWVWFYWKSEYVTSTGSPLSIHFPDKSAEPQQVSAAARGRTESTLPSSQHPWTLWSHPLSQPLLLSWGSCTQASAPPQMFWVTVTVAEWAACNKSSHLGQQLSSHLSSFRTLSGDFMSTSDSPASSPAFCNHPRHMQLICSACCKVNTAWKSPLLQQSCGAFFATALLAQRLHFPSPSNPMSFLRFSALDLKNSPQ